MAANEPKYPEIEVPLVGQAGNAFLIIGRVSQALQDGGVDDDEIELYRKEATSGDYNNVLTTTMRWASIY